MALATFLTAKRDGARASARHEPYPKHETPSAETITDPVRWAAVKEECPDLQLSGEMHGEYFGYSSQRAFTWFSVHRSLPA